MTKILFVCHGNICRSPMAEFVFRDLVAQHGWNNRFTIASAATSTEEIGNPVYPPAARKLREHGISPEGKYAVQVQCTDYERYDLLLVMDRNNLRNLHRIIRKDPDQKIFRLLDFTDHPRDIADPWYTGDFEQTYQDVLEGCTSLLCDLQKRYSDNLA